MSPFLASTTPGQKQMKARLLHLRNECYFLISPCFKECRVVCVGWSVIDCCLTDGARIHGSRWSEKCVAGVWVVPIHSMLVNWVLFPPSHLVLHDDQNQFLSCSKIINVLCFWCAFVWIWISYPVLCFFTSFLLLQRIEFICSCLVGFINFSFCVRFFCLSACQTAAGLTAVETGRPATEAAGMEVSILITSPKSMHFYESLGYQSVRLPSLAYTKGEKTQTSHIYVLLPNNKW